MDREATVHARWPLPALYESASHADRLRLRSMSSAQSNSSEGDTVELRPQVICGQGTLSIGYHGSKPTALGQLGDAADLTGLVPDSRYTFKVVATNRFGDSPESDGLRARTPDLEYSWGHQADHTAKYAKGTIGSSIIEDAIHDYLSQVAGNL